MIRFLKNMNKNYIETELGKENRPFNGVDDDDKEENAKNQRNWPMKIYKNFNGIEMDGWLDGWMIVGDIGLNENGQKKF